jgi:hypothetical protein
MPIEYEMKCLFDITKSSIQSYSEALTSASWFWTIEEIVLRGILDNNKNVTECFHDYQLSAMKELIRRGLWVKWCDKQGKVVLSPDPLYKLTIWDDTQPIPCGAD